MAGIARSNHPGGRSPAVAVDGGPSFVKVQRLQRRLWAAAKQSEGRRFHALHAGQADAWTEEWFNGHGLYRLRGTIRYPKTA